MNTYITGSVIRQLRELRGLTQAQLAERISVSDKAVSKWETGRGLPDITLLEPLAEVLGVSVLELMRGERVVNRNVSCNMRRTRFYVCPVCGNVLHSTGDAVISCCGVTLPPLEAEAMEPAHDVRIEAMEGEHFLTIDHPMTKEHYISFAAFAGDDRLQLVKFYPEGNAETRMQLRGRGDVYLYCNRHGLFRKRI